MPPCIVTITAWQAYIRRDILWQLPCSDKLQSNMESHRRDGYVTLGSVKKTVMEAAVAYYNLLFAFNVWEKPWSLMEFCISKIVTEFQTRKSSNAY